MTRFLEDIKIRVCFLLLDQIYDLPAISWRLETGNSHRGNMLGGVAVRTRIHKFLSWPHLIKHFLSFQKIFYPFQINRCEWHRVHTKKLWLGHSHTPPDPFWPSLMHPHLKNCFDCSLVSSVLWSTFRQRLQNVLKLVQIETKHHKKFEIVQQSAIAAPIVLIAFLYPNSNIKCVDPLSWDAYSLSHLMHIILGSSGIVPWILSTISGVTTCWYDHNEIQ